MRITPEILLKVARDTISQRTKEDRDILAVYLHGSLLSGAPNLGGTADVDLFFVHSGAFLVEREIIRLTDDLHLDIVHHSRSDYRHSKELRLNPWMGSTIYSCKVLYDPQHFMDFTQASVRGQFNSSENVILRSNSLAAKARQLWLSLDSSNAYPEDGGISMYLRALELAANSIACLTGAPLTERRFLILFKEKAQAVGRQGLHHGILGLLGASSVNNETLHTWLPSWRAAYQAIPQEKRPAGLHPYRLNYYYKAFESILTSETPEACLWPLLQTWLQASSLIQSDSNSSAFQEVLAKLGFLGEDFRSRLTALDAYLDTVEETVEAWGQKIGA